MEYLVNPLTVHPNKEEIRMRPGGREKAPKAQVNFMSGQMILSAYERQGLAQIICPLF